MKRNSAQIFIRPNATIKVSPTMALCRSFAPHISYRLGLLIALDPPLDFWISDLQVSPWGWDFKISFWTLSDHATPFPWRPSNPRGWDFEFSFSSLSHLATPLSPRPSNPQDWDFKISISNLSVRQHPLKTFETTRQISSGASWMKENRQSRNQGVHQDHSLSS